MMIMLIYTWAYEVTSLNEHYFENFILNLCVYIKIPRKKDIFWDTILNSNIYLYVN